MKAQGKVLQAVLIVLVVVVLVLIFAVYLFGGRVLRAGIGKVASTVLNVNVGLGDLQLDLLRGNIGISDLQVGNPAGYSANNLFELRNAAVKAQMSSLLSQTIRINEIKLDGMALTVEQKGLSTNLNDLLKAVTAGTPATRPQEPGAAGRNLHIGVLEITDTTVRVKVQGGPEIPLKLDTIRMENLGADQPISVAALSGKILAALAAGIAEQGAGILPKEITSGLESGLKNLGEAGSGLIEGGRGVLEQGVGAGTGALQGILPPRE
ncbi:MAG TPA: AsmA family protein [Sedimentisphaerales bacterium]|nr:AsmA family protein [Sedimentisphaerales bacterium]